MSSPSSPSSASSSAPALAVRLDRAAPVPLGVQLATVVRDRIGDGRLPAGTRLPSSRALARELGTARAVVEQAYAQLVAEGWLVGRAGAGTFVAADTARAPRAPHSPEPGAAGTGGAPAARRGSGPPSTGRPLLRLDSGTPWIDPRHRDAWRRAWREVGAAEPPSGYADPRGLPALREALAARLGRTRGLVVDADAVRVTAGTTDGLRHLLAALRPGPVGVEDPGYRAAVAVVRACGRAVVDLPVDVVHRRTEPRHLEGLAAAYTTPAHQHPLGPPMPAPARVALLDAAAATGTVLVEDDYDSEFRYDVAPIPALAASAPDRVAYLGTASKTVAPSLRLGWLVAPPSVREEVDRHRARTHEVAAWPVQRAFLALLREGYVDRVVRSARAVYADRAARVAAALGPWLPAPADAVRGAAGPLAGMYATVPLDPAATDRAVAAAAAAGYEVPRLADYARGAAPAAARTGLVLGFGGCTDDQLDDVLAVLVTALS